MPEYYPYHDGYLAILHKQLVPNRPTIIFLHDALGSIETWRGFPEKLCAQTKCNLLIYDRLGHGHSSRYPEMLIRPNEYMEQEADILFDLLNDFRIEKPILFGHSDGGTIALLAAAKTQNTIGAVITVAGHIYVEDITVNGIREVQKGFNQGNLKQKLAKYHGEKTKEVFGAWTNTWLNPGFRNWNISTFLPKINIPTLIIQGENDEFASPTHARDIQKGIGNNAELMFIKEAGHFPHKDCPSEIIDITTTFINRLRI